MIAVLDYGIGNLRSAQKALEKLGADARLVTDPDEAASAPAIVLPGVGAFGRCMQALRNTGLDKVVHDAVETHKPFMAICIGMQMLYEGSEEDPGVEGLGILETTVRRLSPEVKHPQMQWNMLRLADRTHPMFAGLDHPAWVYFVHSYAPEPTSDVIATCDYGGEVVAAVAQGPLWAAQFHPEKSSTTGLALLGNFVQASAAA